MTPGRPFDCVFLSYDEPLADVLYERLSSVLGAVKRLHGVHGTHRAYRLTAEMVDTEQFLIADADFEISRSFSVHDITPLAEHVDMRVWMARNPVNGLTYGYGAIKLVRRAAVRSLGISVDILASVPGDVEFSSVIAGTSRFNQSPFHAWRAAFRECSRLARGCEYGTSKPRAEEWLQSWRNIQTDADFAQWVGRGAEDGITFARETGLNSSKWEMIHKAEWLRERFQRVYGDQLR